MSTKPKMAPNAYRQLHKRGSQSAKATIDRAKRVIVAKALASGEELPLNVMLDNMAWAMRQARTQEKLAEGVETRAQMAEVRDYRELAQAAAQAAAPYLHAKLAPIVAKGEKGIVVNLVIEDA